MGLDIDIMTHDNEDMVSFRRHEILLDRLNAVVEDTERPELGVSELKSLVEEFEDEMIEAGMSLPELDIGNPQTQKDIVAGLPEYFCDDAPKDWAAALPHYRLLFSRLIPIARQEVYLKLIVTA